MICWLVLPYLRQHQLNGRISRQRNNAWPTVSIAAWALHVTQRNSDGSLRVTRLHAKVQVNHGAPQLSQLMTNQ